MSFWNRVTEQATEKLKQGREQLSNLQQQTAKPLQSPRASQGMPSRIPQLESQHYLASILEKCKSITSVGVPAGSPSSKPSPDRSGSEAQSVLDAEQVTPRFIVKHSLLLGCCVAGSGLGELGLLNDGLTWPCRSSAWRR